jgi:hypothetical protein
MQVAINSQTGEIGIDLFGGDAIQTTAGGSLVTIKLHVRDTSPLGVTGIELVTQVNPTADRVFQTLISDSKGALTLHQSATSFGLEPGEPGEVNIVDWQPGGIDVSSHHAPRDGGFVTSCIAIFLSRNRARLSASLVPICV